MAAKPKAKATKPAATVSIPQLDRRITRCRIIGTSPLIMNSMAVKAQRTLFIGGTRKTAAQRAGIKHHPYEEFVQSTYRHGENEGAGATRLYVPGASVKGAMATSALETPGVSKASIQRLLSVPAERIDVYGVPFLRCDVVRSADMAKTPDIRTRACLPEWCAEFDISYISPQISFAAVAHMLSNAGLVVGIGDYRIEKGRGSFGGFRHVSKAAADVKEFERIVAEGGLAAQDAALTHPMPLNAESQMFLEMYEDELVRRDGPDVLAAAE